MTPYEELISRKRVSFRPKGFECGDLPADMFAHQRAMTRFAIEGGCVGIFADTGLGKTRVALSWCDAVLRHTGRPVLMLAPLAVGPQHQREAERFGIDARYVRDPLDFRSDRINITNYDRLHLFPTQALGGIALDESSIIKNFTGVTSRKLIETFAETPYRLLLSATPAPNDYTELGTSAEFLGVMRRDEMLPRWFIHDSMDTGTWRLKKHAVRDYFRWVASWSRCIARPSDIGLSDDGFVLPELRIHHHMVEADRSLMAGEEKNGQLRIMRIPDTSATAIHREKRLTAQGRAEAIAAVVNAAPSDPWIVWCDTDYEADALKATMPDATEVRGSMTIDKKEDRIVGFSEGRIRVLITKPSVCGHGLNWQHCASVAFVGLSFSYEQYYQAIRRCWRYGQTRAVDVHIAMADTERSIWDVVSRKAGDHDAMKAHMSAAMIEAHQSQERKVAYIGNREPALPAWL